MEKQRTWLHEGGFDFMHQDPLGQAVGPVSRPARTRRWYKWGAIAILSFLALWAGMGFVAVLFH